MQDSTSLPTLNRVYHVHFEVSYDFGRQTRYFATVVAAPDENIAWLKAKQRSSFHGEIINHLIYEQKGARW